MASPFLLPTGFMQLAQVGHPEPELDQADVVQIGFLFGSSVFIIILLLLLKMKKIK